MGGFLVCWMGLQPVPGSIASVPVFMSWEAQIPIHSISGNSLNGE